MAVSSLIPVSVDTVAVGLVSSVVVYPLYLVILFLFRMARGKVRSGDGCRLLTWVRFAFGRLSFAFPGTSLLLVVLHRASPLPSLCLPELRSLLASVSAQAPKSRFWRLFSPFLPQNFNVCVKHTQELLSGASLMSALGTSSAG